MWKRDLYIMGSRIDPVNEGEALKAVSAMMSETMWHGKSAHYIVTVNPEIVLHGLKDDDYRRVLVGASLALADGFGLQIAGRVFHEKIEHRITGVDFTVKTCQLAAMNEWPVFLVGAHESAAKAAELLKKLIPSLRIAGTHPGTELKYHGNTLSYNDSENDKLIQCIVASGAKIIFVAFGAPKQELWIKQNLQKMPGVKVAMGVGGSFDYLAGKIKRAPRWMRQLGLEWLYRAYQQPSRLPRIFNATLNFLAYVLMCRLRIWLMYRRNVVALIYDAMGRVLLVAPQRSEEFLWQFPQGGVNPAESSDKAVIREMSEELGTENFDIVRKYPNFNAYVWPKWAQCAQCYKGQRQTLYILKFKGKDSEIDLKKGKELKAWQWVTPDKAFSTVDYVRKPLVSKALKEYKKLTIEYGSQKE